MRAAPRRSGAGCRPSRARRRRRAPAAMTTRAEFEWPVAGAAPRSAALRHDAVSPDARRRGAERPHVRASRPTSRARRFRSRLRTARWRVLCIDVGEMRTDDGGPRDPRADLRIEIELEAGNVARLFELAHALAADLPLAFEPASKAERGYALRRPRTPAPVRAGDADLPDKATAGDAFAAIIRSCLRADRRQRARRCAPTTTRSGSTRCASACVGCARACRWRARGMADRARRTVAGRVALARAGARTGARLDVFATTTLPRGPCAVVAAARRRRARSSRHWPS